MAYAKPNLEIFSHKNACHECIVVFSEAGTMQLCISLNTIFVAYKMIMLEIFLHKLGWGSRRQRSCSWRGEEISSEIARRADCSENLPFGQSRCDGFCWTHRRCTHFDQSSSGRMPKPQAKCRRSRHT